MLKKIVTLLFSLLPFWAVCQNNVTLHFTDPAFDERYHKSKLIVPVFKITSPEIEEYEKFGAPVKKGLDKFTIKKLPDMTGCRDTAYAFIYFTGYSSNTNRGYITMLVGNYRRGFDTTKLFIDKNNNLDFTDDGPAEVMPYFQHTINITLPNGQANGAAYNLKLSRFELDKDEMYQKLMDDFYTRNQGNKQFAGILYSFRENRMNMVGATYRGETDTFRIGLYDGNYDGMYTNAEFDRIFVGKPGDSIFRDDYRFNFQDAKKDAEFEWNFKVYKITDFDPAGRFITFYWDKNAVSKRALQVGKKIPKFEFYLSDAKKKQKIKKYRRKGLYIFFYNFESETFEEDTAALRQIQTRFGNCVQVVTLNYGDYYKTLNAMKVLDAIPYTVGLSNRGINRQFNIEKLPMGFLCRKHLRLSHIGISPKEVLELLEKGSKK